MKKFAFLLMGLHYSPSKHQATFETSGQITCILTVNDFDEARRVVKQLWHNGFGAVELCGAFGPDKAALLREDTCGELAIGYVVHDPSQDRLFEQFFSKP